MAKANFNSYEHLYTFDEGTEGEFKLIIRKGPSGYGKHYVLDGATRRYLSKGAQSNQGAQMDMHRIAAEIRAARA
ncbi:hypothetical protein KHO57_gp045 [Mycobacterium phage Phabba]|uniref:Uncharacterized protein n=1 Tax=Mycobacterium phage Phabba TaxID=2027899 RepID=A0A249XSJ0_9CAUD|nr:hypothetical protein KHO57_gp045 [Mycobacterium phage Phabba]ASZ74620.1 hypothetical protein SEA_PHABBA_45 [Mycobacterium phage Phabba]